MRKKTSPYLILCLLLLAQSAFSQKTRVGLGFTPHRTPSNIHGLALGIWDNSLQYPDTSMSINGIHFSVLGFGSIVPLLPGSPFDRYGPFDSKGLEILSLKRRMDSLSRNPYFGRLYLNGISISGLGTGYDRVNGIQIGLSGLAWIQNGLMISPIVSIVGSGRGLAISLNNHVGMYRGVLLGLNNGAIYLKGLQLGIFNQIEGRGDVQLGLVNLANEINYQGGCYNVSFVQNGLQIGIVNRTKTRAFLQFGIVNRSGFCSGFQLGVLNISDQNKGLQLGLVNYTKKKKSLQIGLINIKGKKIRPFLQW